MVCGIGIDIVRTVRIKEVNERVSDEIDVINPDSGKPIIKHNVKLYYCLINNLILNIYLSMIHEHDYVVAHVISFNDT